MNKKTIKLLVTLLLFFVGIQNVEAQRITGYSYYLPEAFQDLQEDEDCPSGESYNIFACYKFTYNGISYKAHLVVNDFDGNRASDIEEFTNKGYEHRTDLFTGCTFDEELHTLSNIRKTDLGWVLATISYIDDVKFGFYIVTKKHKDLLPFEEDDYELLADFEICGTYD